MKTRITVPDIRSRKVASGAEPITALTAYDYTMARFLDRAGIELILVGDSLGSIIQGAEHTLAVELEDMVYHTRCVAAGIEHALLVGDLPFLSYQVSNEQALLSSGMLIQKGKAHAVKLEGGVAVQERIAFLTRFDVPVMAHIGLTPQSFHRMGGHKRQGVNRPGARAAALIEEDALAVQEAGAFAVVLEGVPQALAERITNMLSIPTIGIAAGAACDGQILVTNDLLGFNADGIPPFVQPLANLGVEIGDAVQKYCAAVKGTTKVYKDVSNT